MLFIYTGTSSGGVSPSRKEQPLFTLRQVGMICERLLKEREEKVREEYEETMTSKLAGWYPMLMCLKKLNQQMLATYFPQLANNNCEVKCFNWLTLISEQYDTFVKFTHDQLMRRFGEQPASCEFLFIFNPTLFPHSM